MSDHSLEASLRKSTIFLAAAPAPRIERAIAFRLVLSVVVGVCLIVPESEIRAKLFKAGMIASNIRRSLF